MANIYIIHRWDGDPNESLYQWLKDQLEKEGHTVTIPKMPDPEVPTIEGWVNKLKEVIRPSSDAILIGHSIGCQAILRALEELAGGSVKGLVLIAPWMELKQELIEEEGEEVEEIARPWVETPIDFEKVKSRAGKVITIFSDDDYYVPNNQKEFFDEKLNADSFMLSGYKHFTEDDGITKLDVAVAAVNSIEANQD